MTTERNRNNASEEDRAFEDTLCFYRASVEFHDISGDDITDAGIKVSDLEPIETCCLTPGDPSPIGRTPDGDLAYLVRRDIGDIALKRESAGALAALMAKTLANDGGALRETWPGGKDFFDDAIESLLSCAAPRALFGDTAHGSMRRTAVLKSLLGALYDTNTPLGYAPKN